MTPHPLLISSSKIKFLPVVLCFCMSMFVQVIRGHNQSFTNRSGDSYHGNADEVNIDLPSLQVVERVDGTNGELRTLPLLFFVLLYLFL